MFALRRQKADTTKSRLLSSAGISFGRTALGRGKQPVHPIHESYRPEMSSMLSKRPMGGSKSSDMSGLRISWPFTIRIKSTVRRNDSFDTLLRIDYFAVNAEIICWGLQNKCVATRG